MKYYLHDSSSFQDEKITELFIEFGYEGLGLFYTTLEKFALQEKPIKTEVLKKQLNVGKRLNKCWHFMESLGLISSNNGETFSKQLLKFSEKYKIKKEKDRKRISEWRKNQDIKKNVTCNERVRNALKVNRSKVNESKVTKVIPAFEEFKIHALSKEKNIDLKALKNKYDSWVENGWKDGHNKKISNWKSKLSNTITYIPKNEANKTNSQKREIRDIPTGNNKTTWD